MTNKRTLEEFRLKLQESGTKLKKTKRDNKPWEDWALELLEELVKHKGAKATIRKVYREYVSQKSKKTDIS
jgi:hypothetical protein